MLYINSAFLNSFFLCEMLNIVNVTGQAYFLLEFFNGQTITDAGTYIGLPNIADYLISRNYTYAFEMVNILKKLIR